MTGQSMDGWSFSGGAAGGERHPGWPARLGPVTLPVGPVALRPFGSGDRAAWQTQRVRDETLISPWDATSPLSWADRHSNAMFRGQRRLLRRAAGRGEILPFAITVGDRFAGQVTLGGIQRGALSSCWVGYWVESGMQRSGVATVAVAQAVAHAFGPVGLHRVDATISPENAASIAVVGHLGFRREGYLERYLDVGGGWRDHLLFALTAEELYAEDRNTGRAGGGAAETGETDVTNVNSGTDVTNQLVSALLTRYWRGRHAAG